MIGSFLTRGLVMILGYAYPAYECFKTVEKNKPEIEQLRFWCQYWILVAVMTVFERVGDTFVSWVPMYSEAKLAFIIYLWYPKTKGTKFVYDSFFQPYVSKHETEIDRNLLELRSRAGDMAFMYCQRAVSFGQTRIFEVLQYVATRSTPIPHPKQAEQQALRATQISEAVAASKSAAPRQQPTSAQAQPPPPPQPQPRPHPPVEESLSSTSSTSSSPQEDETEDEQSSVQGSSTSASALPPLPPPSPLKKSISMPVAPPSPRRPITTKAETMQLSKGPPKMEKPSVKSPTRPQETVMEESIRLTRGRLRKTRSAGTK